MTIQQLLHVQDRKDANTSGGTPSTGTNVRDLNTIVTNEISASLSTDQITLLAGTYMCRALAPAYRCSRHRAYLYNTSDSSIEVLGTNNFCTNSAGNNQQNFSMVNGRFTISSTKTFELRHFIQSPDSQGFGFETNNGQKEIYSNIMIRKIVDDFPLMHIRDEKSTGTDGGTATLDSFNVRTLNTIKGINEITGASLASDTITLPAGGYYIFIWAPMWLTREGKVHFYNKDDATYDVIGANMRASSTTNHGNAAITQGYFEISAVKDFEIRHWIAVTAATFGLGIATDDGETEVYTEVLIKKIV